jgi:hypothetical protein
VNRWWYLGAFVAAMPAIVADAHHSIAAVYDSTQQITVEGSVTEFRFVNPHPVLIIAVADSPTPLSWQLEMDNRFELAAIGMTAETFKPGERVVATGSRNRTQAQSLYVRRLDRPADGFRYEQIGSRPRVDVGRAAPRDEG